jgi:hypothetical protein
MQYLPGFGKANSPSISYSAVDGGMRTATTTFIRYVCIGRGLDRIKGRSLATPTPRPTAHGGREKGSPSPLIEPSIFHVPTVQESNHTMHLHRPVPCSSIGRSSKQAKASARGQEATAKSGGCSTDREVSPSAAKARLVFPYAAIACAACSTEHMVLLLHAACVQQVWTGTHLSFAYRYNYTPK